jgi:cytochrome c-type biogenesis protein CcsB
MEKLSKALFSMRMMALAMFIFLFAIATATILESKYDIQTAKIIVYNALWFEILLIFLSINLIANIFRYKMYQREKIALFTFHISFLVILLGAGITRFFSFEGLMLIRENEQSNFIFLSEPHVWMRINDGKMQYTLHEKKYLSEVTDNHFSYQIDFPNHKTPIKVEYVDFKMKQIDSLIIDDNIKGYVLEIVTDGMKSNYLNKDNFTTVGNVPISFEKANPAPGIEIFEENNELKIKSQFPLKYLPMTEMQKARETGAAIPDSLYKTVEVNTVSKFYETTLYLVNEQQFVFRRKINNAKMTKLSSGKKDVGLDILTLKITDGNQTKIVALEGGAGSIPGKEVFQFNGLQYEMEYGSTKKELPFSILCRDFQLEKYPGSEVASSFASEVTVIDEKNKVKKDKRIFMNNVMDYGGYRFFQSSYDLDNPQTTENEEGTRLSVNHDFWGTNISYLGYLLMALGMIFSLFAPNGRFKDLLNVIKKSRERREKSLLSVLIFVLSFSFASFSQEHNHEGHEHEHNHEHEAATVTSLKPNLEFHYISLEHSEKMANLLVQDFQGRIIPFHTLCDQLLRKIYGKNKYDDKNAIQVIMSMQMYPEYWLTQKVISIPTANQEQLKLSKHANYTDLFDEQKGEFRWMNAYNNAHQKLESKRSEFDKKLIKLVERFQVYNSVLSWEYFKIIPLKNSANNLWVSPLSRDFANQDSSQFKQTFTYFSSLHQGASKNTWGMAEDNLTQLKDYQKSIAKAILPSDKAVNLEISYNKMNIFKNSMYSYLLLGFVLLLIFFVRIFVTPTQKSEIRFKNIAIPFTVIMGIIFLYHGAGLGMRWYISGHAPWSNGYEAVIFIAWVTLIAGFIFSRKNPVVLAGTAILAFFMIFVTEMNLLDPEITPLQPVLKSYWLMIHVAIITGSYGFLGLGAILGLLNLVLYLFRFKNNGQRITSHINEITAVSELTITIGLFMLTIGTFLGGIWANESWGRYWGWDPKETWALVSVLVYAIILHLKYIPGLAGKFTFNLVSFWGYSAILFTFFGVNFYLVGLHSYAQGEGLAEIPSWISYTVFAFILFSILSFIRFKQYKKQINEIN